MRPTRTRSSGMSLLELAIAGAIGLIAAGSVAGVFITTQNQHDESSLRSEVLAASVSLLEEIKGKTPRNIAYFYGGNRYAYSDTTSTLAQVVDTTTLDGTRQPLLTEQDQTYVTTEVIESTAVDSDSPILTVTVDDSDPTLILVTIDASWVVDGSSRSLALETTIYDTYDGSI